jgi:hypothetical protein
MIKSQSPHYYLLKTKRGLVARRAFSAPSQNVLVKAAPLKRIISSRLKAHLMDLRKPVKPKLLPVSEIRRGELVSKWRRRNNGAVLDNTMRRIRAEMAQTKNRDIALVCEHIVLVLEKSPAISSQDIGRAVIESLRAARVSRFPQISNLPLNESAVKTLFRDLVKKGIIVVR